MASSIQVYQERVNVAGGHNVITTVQSATLIPKELFVFNQTDDTFSHVATVNDLVYPTASDPAWSHYRLDTVTRSFEDVSTAIEYASHVKSRLEAVTIAYTQDADDFSGSELTTYTG